MTFRDEFGVGRDRPAVRVIARGSPGRTGAISGIRGAIINQLSRAARLPRSVRQHMREVN